MPPEEIAARLRRAICDRSLLPGQNLNQDELARSLGVSRIPLREALRTLLGEGLVVIRPGLGATVARLDVADVEELYELRAQLEPPIARLLPEQARPRDVTELGVLVDRMCAVAGSDLAERSRLEYAFQRRLYGLSEKAHSVRLVTQVLNLLEPYSRCYAPDLGGREEECQTFGAQLEALRSGDGGKLSELVHTSIREARDALLSVMKEAPGGADHLSRPGL